MSSICTPLFEQVRMSSTDHVRASLDRILRSGEFVCRPRRQIFVEHTFTDRQGNITRQVTPADLQVIAQTGNQNALNGDLAPIGIGHTYDDLTDAQGNLVRKFSEAEQPKPIGYLHNYSVAQRPDGKWALYADEWIQKVIQDETGRPVDGVRYAETFPRRSAEYFPSKKWIDWLALLRRAPALNMGLDIYAHASLHPDKAHYMRGRDGKNHLGAIIDNHGKLRYAAEEDMEKPPGSEGQVPGMDSPEAQCPPPSAAAPSAPPTPGSPAAPADDRPAIPDGMNSNELPPEHQEAAERYAQHVYGMHHSQVKALKHHAHSMYAAALGLPPDKMAPYTPAPIPTAMPGAVPGADPLAPAAPPSPMEPPAPASPPAASGGPVTPHVKNDAASPPATGPGVPGNSNAFIPGEVKRMSAVQAGIEQHRFASEVEKERYARQQLEARINVIELEKRQMRYEMELTNRLKRGVSLDLVKEMARAEKWSYAQDRCSEQLACIDENYPKAPIGDSFIDPTLGSITGSLPSRAGQDLPGKDTYEESQKAKKYAAKHGVDYNTAMDKIRGA